MLDVLIVILIVIMFVFGSWQIITYAIRSLKARTQLNRSLFIAFITLGFGVLVDCFRTLSFMFLGGVWEPFDRVSYFIKFFLLFLGVSAVLRVAILLHKQSGQKTTYETQIRYFYLILVVIISLLNYYTYVKTPELESGLLTGFYAYQVNPFLYLFILIFYIPLFFYILIKIRAVFKVVKKKYLATEVIILGFLVAALFNERNINIAAYLVFDPVIIILIEFSLIAAIAVIGFISALKYPNLIDDVSAHFSLKAIYLLRKHGGNILFEHHFKETPSSNPNKLLMGGFLYAISSGLEEAFHLRGEIKKIKVGDTIILFEYGALIYGLLFVSERIPFLHEQLKRIIEKVESQYPQAIGLGDFSEINSDQIQQWVLEVFQ